jgi:hypothetical protein
VAHARIGFSFAREWDSRNWATGIAMASNDARGAKSSSTAIVSGQSQALMEILLSASEPLTRNEGAIVLWVYRDYGRNWCVRKEGGALAAAFSSRKKALAVARTVGEAWGSYHLFLQLDDGRVTEEFFNLRQQNHRRLALSQDRQSQHL